MDKIIKSAAQRLKREAESLRIGPEVSNNINDTLQTALNELLEPLKLENTKTMPHLFIGKEDESKLKSLSKKRKRQMALPESGDEHDSDTDMSDASAVSDVPIAKGHSAEWIFVVGDKHVKAWEYLGDEWSQWVVCALERNDDPCSKHTDSS